MFITGSFDVDRCVQDMACHIKMQLYSILVIGQGHLVGYAIAFFTFCVS